ncbi:MAG: YegP family protein [Wenzhouxiangellaceae bacterium]|nr:YegP family protein [Wenzhouxiangellaceae bacterium]
MAGKFEIYKDKAGEFRFRLKAANHQTVLSSEGYKTKKSCENGIDSVKKNCSDPKRFAMNKTPTGKFRFNLTSTNGQIIGTSQNYAGESGCRNGIKAVAAAADGASTVDQTG